ncbi:MAG: ribosome biogenesis GTPase YlqF, partial [Lactobacillus iners]|nr:ribosome biogenesis GTPase YlqF [Lactobacillus iners]
AIKDSVFHADDVSIFVLKYLREQYLNLLVDFCKTSAEKIEKINDIDLLLAMTQLFGMRDDYVRFSIFFLQRLRKGKIGRITFDLP